ncbi:hypothetical protein JJL91_004372 [Salmonella enterica]|nr:hypothetical protein [Escherichia coli]EGZ8459838.1 hypothetical protein [Salmonella enterica]
MASLSEEFKDQKVNDLLEDYIALGKKIEEVHTTIIDVINETPARFDGVLSEKLSHIIQSSFEINQAIEKEKFEIKETGATTKEKLTNEITALISSLKANQEQTNQTYQKQLDSVARAAKPFSTSKAIAICAACTLFISAAFSGAFWYVAQSQKEQDLRFYASGYTDLLELTQDTIKRLPKDQQNVAQAKLATIENRTK